MFPSVIHVLQTSLQVTRLLAVGLHKLSTAQVDGEHDGLALIQSLLQLLHEVQREESQNTQLHKPNKSAN